jgi:membrane associated rhomboid family serine protease
MPPVRSSYHASSLIYGYLPRGIKWLLISNTAIFLVYFLGGQTVEHYMTAWLALTAQGAIKTLMVWQVVTYLFLHGGIGHIFWNMLGLYFFGTPIEQDWGTQRFLRFYFSCGAVAGLCVLAANIITGDWVTPTIGASGAILAVLVAFGVLYPEQIILLVFIPIKAKYLVMIYAAIELLTLLKFGTGTGVSTVAHVGGMAFGYLFVKRRLPLVRMPDVSGAYRRWKMQRAKRKFQTYMRKHDGGRSGPWVN